MGRWSVDKVLSLAPDSASAAAARRLARPLPWTDLGATDDAVWGRCAGTGRSPYQAVVDLGGPAYQCSCPSRKSPCKHALALLLMWSQGQVASRSEASEFAASWLTRRRTAQPAQRAGPARSESDPEAAARRAQRRTERVSAGLAELDQWLCDQVRDGLAGADRLGYADLDRMAARLVDAQAQPVAAAVRSLAGLRGRPDWPDRMLAELALLRLLCAAHSRLSALPAGLAANVRARTGYQIGREEVLGTDPVLDTWYVLAQADTEDDPVRTRRVWLAGAHSGRTALLLSFAAFERQFDLEMTPGEAFVGGVHFYPGDPPLRALPDPSRVPGPAPAVTGSSVEAALRQWSVTLAADPWTTSWPVLLQAVVPVVSERATHLVDHTGATPPLREDGLRYGELLARSGGRPIQVFGELTPDAFRVRSVVAADD